MTEYERLHTFRGSVFSKDNNVWAVSPQFASRMSMPASMIDSSLPEGVLALAIRYQRYGIQICDDQADPQCYRPANCYLDLYFDANTPLPWLDQHNAHVDIDNPDSSWFYLRFDPQDFAQVMAPRGLVLTWKQKQELGTNVLPARVVEYQKQLFREIDFVSSVFDCQGVSGDKAVLTLSGKGQPFELTMPVSLLHRAKDKVKQTQAEVVPQSSQKGATPDVFRQAKFRLTPNRKALNQIKHHLKPDYIWAYSLSFAQRFNLPLKWVSDELNDGVEALVYRNQRFDKTKCGYFRQEDKCYSTTSFFYLDVFTRFGKVHGAFDSKRGLLKKGQLNTSFYQLYKSMEERKHWDAIDHFNGNLKLMFDTGWIFEHLLERLAPTGTEYYQKGALDYDYTVVGFDVYESNNYLGAEIELYPVGQSNNDQQRFDYINIPRDFVERAQNNTQEEMNKGGLIKDVFKRFGLNK